VKLFLIGFFGFVVYRDFIFIRKFFSKIYALSLPLMIFIFLISAFGYYQNTIYGTFFRLQPIVVLTLTVLYSLAFEFLGLISYGIFL
jgi:hypothetical protein